MPPLPCLLLPHGHQPAEIYERKQLENSRREDIVSVRPKCPEQEQELMEAKVYQFLQTVLLMINKHFNKWAAKNIFISLFSEAQTGSVAAHIFLSEQYRQEGVMFWSEEHKQEINACEF